MASLDLARVRKKARTAYELARVRRAVVGFAPALLLVAVAALLARSLGDVAPFGCAMFVIGVVALWYGRDPKRAVLPGLLAGLVPFVLTLAAMRMGHVCFGASCTNVCLAACTLGGLGAGFAIGHVGVRRRYGAGYYLAASAVSVATGAMGCVCLGWAGLGGLVLGYGAGVVPALLVRIAKRA
jgi:hypothetical protein